MGKQQNLFNLEPEETTPQHSSPMMIKLNSSTKKGSDKTKLINKKIHKIDLLKRKLEKAKSDLEVIKKTFAGSVPPFEKELFATKEAFILKLFTRYNETGFTEWQKDAMELTIIDECEFLIAHDYDSKKITATHKQILEAQSKRLSPFEKELINDMAKDMLNDFGLGVDDDFDIENLDFENDYFKEFKEKQEGFYREASENNKKEKVLNTDKQFQKLYKSLVKKAHPDLVTSTKDKEGREILMKKLSEAWQERNYYQLLVLKKEIEKDTNEIQIDADLSSSLLRQLDDEIYKWENELYMFKEYDEENTFYFENFESKNTNGLKQKIYKYTTYLTQQKELFSTYILNLKTKAATKKFLKLKRNEFEADNFDFF